MSRFRPRGITVMATLFVVTGLGLMLASLRIESGRTPTTATAADVTIPTVAAVAAARTASVPASDPAATRLFARAQAANRTVAYGGVKQVSRWNKGKQTTVVLTVDHVPGRGTLVAPGDGSSASAAQAATFTVEPAADDEAMMLETLVRNYRLSAGDAVPVLGRQARVLEAYRADDTLAARFWVDEATGLILRRELLTADGGPAETASYTKVDLAPHAKATPTAVPAAAWAVVDGAGVVRLRADGWAIPQTLDDGLTLYQVREQVAAGGSTLQLSYTDGLVGLSVFQQRGVLDRDAMSGFVPVTAVGGEVWVRTNSLFFTWQSRPASSATASGGENQSRDIVVSALADAANAPVGAALVAFPPLAAEDAGVGDHLSRGVQRVGSWIDPLG